MVVLMARVTVSADRAVTGKLPPVCVQTGLATDHVVELDTRIGGPPAWAAVLLLLLGPFGWLVLIGLRGELLAVRVPLHRDAWHANQRITMVGRALIGLGVVGLVAVLMSEPSTVSGALASGALLTGLLTVAASRLLLPRVRLDATRRWVTFVGVNAAFRDAIETESRVSA